MQDLNNHLFAQLERLNQEDLTPEQTALEVDKSKAISLVAKQLANNAKIELEARQLKFDGQIQELPNMLQPKAPLLHGVKTQ